MTRDSPLSHQYFSVDTLANMPVHHGLGIVGNCSHKVTKTFQLYKTTSLFLSSFNFLYSQAIAPMAVNDRKNSTAPKPTIAAPSKLSLITFAKFTFFTQPHRRVSASPRHFYFSFLLQQLDAQSEGEICKSQEHQNILFKIIIYLNI